MMVKTFNILLTIMILQSYVFGHADYSKKHYFAVGVFFGANSQLITYALITEINGNIVGTQILREQRFMYYIMCYWPTPANPDRLNLLEENGIDSCFLTKNYSNKYGKKRKRGAGGKNPPKPCPWLI